jgi:hypothetical protein
MQPTTGNTLAPSYNNSAEAKGMFDLNRFAEHQPELSTEITSADTQPHTEQQQPSIAQLHDLARQEATATMHVAIGNQEAAAPARPVGEGIDTNERLAREEIANDGPAVVIVRRTELALRDLNPEQRASAQLS